MSGTDTALRTVAELEAMPVAATISVQSGTNRQVWTRTTVGWSAGTAVLESAMFAGLAAEGRIMDGSTVYPIQGEWWRNQVYWLYVLKVDTTTQMVQTLCFERISDHGIVTVQDLSFAQYERPRYRRLGEMPAEMLTPGRFQAFITKYMELQTLCSAETEKARVLKNRPDPLLLRAEAGRVQEALNSLNRLIG